jgi:hypothetical protein
MESQEAAGPVLKEAMGSDIPGRPNGLTIPGLRTYLASRLCNISNFVNRKHAQAVRQKIIPENLRATLLRRPVNCCIFEQIGVGLRLMINTEHSPVPAIESNCS